MSSDLYQMLINTYYSLAGICAKSYLECLIHQLRSLFVLGLNSADLYMRFKYILHGIPTEASHVT